MTGARLSDEERDDIRASYKAAVNMTPAALRKWLASDDSRSVGMTAGGDKVTAPGQGESVGHHMGERIIEIAGIKQAELTDDDYRDMRKVSGYVHRHLKQRPSGDVEDTRWRHSLMNWGHEPLKDR